MNLLLATFCLSTLVLPLSKGVEAAAIPIQLEETENVLQSRFESSLETVYNDFTAKGGTIIRLDEGTEPYPLLPGDMVFPSCSGGFNRSQTLWSVLRPYADKIALMKPHATQYGFDPYDGKLKWDSLNRIARPQSYDEFPLWAGIDKSTKFGWDVFGELVVMPEPSLEDQKVMLEYYNSQYFNPDVPAGTRRVYITFARNAHIHLYRLTQANESLKDVVLLFYPLEDMVHLPPPEWNAEPRSIKAYTEMSQLISSRLDLSLL